MTQIVETDAADVQSWLENDEAILIDVREDEELQQARIPTNAVHMPLSRFDPEQVPDADGKKLVFVCAQGIRSFQAGQYLLDQGLITEAYNLTNGIAGWHQAGLPLDMG